MAGTVYNNGHLFEDHRPWCVYAYVDRPMLTVMRVRLLLFQKSSDVLLRLTDPVLHIRRRMTQLLPKPPLGEKPKPTWSLLRRHAMIVPKDRRELRRLQQASSDASGNPILLVNSFSERSAEPRRLSSPKLLRIPMDTPDPVHKFTSDEEQAIKPLFQAPSPLRLLRLDDQTLSSSEKVTTLIEIPPEVKRLRKERNSTGETSFHKLSWPSEYSETARWYAPTKYQLLSLESLLSMVPQVVSSTPVMAPPRLLHSDLIQVNYLDSDLTDKLMEPAKLLCLPQPILQEPRMINYLNEFGRNSAGDIPESKQMFAKQDEIFLASVPNATLTNPRLNDAVHSETVTSLEVKTGYNEGKLVSDFDTTRSNPSTRHIQNDIGVEFSTLPARKENAEVKMANKAVSVTLPDMKMSRAAIDKILQVTDGQSFLSLESGDVSRSDYMRQPDTSKDNIADSNKQPSSPPSYSPGVKRPYLEAIEKKSTEIDGAKDEQVATRKNLVNQFSARSTGAERATSTFETKRNVDVQTASEAQHMHPDVVETLNELDTRLSAVDRVSLRLEEEYRRNQELLANILKLNTDVPDLAVSKPYVQDDKPNEPDTNLGRRKQKQRRTCYSETGSHPSNEVNQYFSVSNNADYVHSVLTNLRVVLTVYAYWVTGIWRPTSAALNRKREQARLDRKTALSNRRCEETITFVGETLSDAQLAYVQQNCIHRIKTSPSSHLSVSQPSKRLCSLTGLLQCPNAPTLDNSAQCGLIKVFPLFHFGTNYLVETWIQSSESENSVPGLYLRIHEAYMLQRSQRRQPKRLKSGNGSSFIVTSAPAEFDNRYQKH
ncbi:hypothetical protein CLF_100548 [Clonorchis sinensis]|uniref:Uncharacterized protein n=1 Tax=Clonorchis sinensis TaxID=79923 RepID=H2KNP9_CLOSI|nr:hypothetical protein CLF_100548 [Clonorchis sinensis]